MIVCISDLHLGNRRSIVLDVIDVLISKLPKQVDKLVLNGDIFEMTLASEEDVIKASEKFFTKLLRKVKINEIVYIPGNHDHVLRSKGFWRFLAHNVAIRVEYPYYSYEKAGTCFLFTHGHHFSPELALAFNGVKSMDDLERRCLPLIKAYWWPNSRELKSWLYERVVLPLVRDRPSDRGTYFRDDAKPITDYGMVQRIRKFCEMVNSKTKKDLHIIFGHTHWGGVLRKQDAVLRVHGRFATIWNTGGWILPDDVWSPDAYVFTIDEKRGKLVADSFKITAKPRKGSGDGDYARSVLKKVLRR